MARYRGLPCQWLGDVNGKGAGWLGGVNGYVVNGKALDGESTG